jgi:hypothetical protein
VAAACTRGSRAVETFALLLLLLFWLLRPVSCVAGILEVLDPLIALLEGPNACSVRTAGISRRLSLGIGLVFNQTAG